MIIVYPNNFESFTTCGWKTGAFRPHLWIVSANSWCNSLTNRWMSTTSDVGKGWITQETLGSTERFNMCQGFFPWASVSPCWKHQHINQFLQGNTIARRHLSIGHVYWITEVIFLWLTTLLTSRWTEPHCYLPKSPSACTVYQASKYTSWNAQLQVDSIHLDILDTIYLFTLFCKTNIKPISNP